MFVLLGYFLSLSSSYVLPFTEATRSGLSHFVIISLSPCLFGLLWFVNFVFYVCVCRGGPWGFPTPAKHSASQLHPALLYSKVLHCLRASPSCLPNIDCL